MRNINFHFIINFYDIYNIGIIGDGDKIHPYILFIYINADFSDMTLQARGSPRGMRDI